MLDNQGKWEYLKYNIRKYTSKFSKELAKNTNKTTDDLSIMKNIIIMLIK